MHEDGIAAGDDVLAVFAVVRRRSGHHRRICHPLATGAATDRCEYRVYVQRHDAHLHDVYRRFAFRGTHHGNEHHRFGHHRNRNRFIGTLMIYIIITICTVFIAACAQMLLKQGARKGYTPRWRQYINPWVISGYTIMFLSMAANIWCMHRGLQLKELSIIESTAYFFVPALAWLCFREPVSRRKALAIGVIIIGVIVFFL